MTESTPGQLAMTDQANAAADKFIDEMLTDMVSQIDQGVRHANITARIGGGILRFELSEVQRLVLASRALARLARMHHAVEQLADQCHANVEFLTEAGLKRRTGPYAECAAELRKLVDDHG